ncbi:MAG: hypothetical protein PHD15_03885 [Clostridia bacterium]|nr:hypothetical protein [Clostridia bacterium]MDD4386882.1 hypothetical protein [Clostridia bacterium]
MESEKKKLIRVGSFTFGIMMILIGINIFLQTITSLDLFRFTLSLWPIVFILLGIETLYYSYKKDIEIKYDILGIITIFIVLFLGIIFSSINYGVNKILYNKEISSDIVYYLTDTDYNINFDDKVNINNISQENVTVKYLEDKEAEYVSVRVKFEYNELYRGSIIRILKDGDLLKNVIDIYYDSQKMNITPIPDYIKNIEIIVTTNDKSKLEYNGTIIY